MLIVIKVIYTLMRPQTHVIDVKYLGSPLKIKVRRPYIVILVPTFLYECFSEFRIPPLNNEDFFIKRDTIFAFPCREINKFWFFLPISFFFSLFRVILIFFLFLFFRSSHRILLTIVWLILQASKLLAGQVVKLDTSFIPSFRLDVLLQDLL